MDECMGLPKDKQGEVSMIVICSDLKSASLFVPTVVKRNDNDDNDDDKAYLPSVT